MVVFGLSGERFNSGGHGTMLNLWIYDGGVKNSRTQLIEGGKTNLSPRSMWVNRWSTGFM